MLDQHQRLAAAHKDGPALVLAGPGSGKTTVLVSRIRALTERYGVSSDKILVVTFTRDAARQMQARFLAMGGRYGGFVTFGTLHGICYHILKSTAGASRLSLITPELKQKLLRRILKGIGVSYISQEITEAFFGDIERLRRLGSYDAFVPESGLSVSDIVTGLNAYEKAKAEYDVMDFGDMISRTLSLFTTGKELLAEYRNRYSYILADEFQDLDREQFEILRLLADGTDNIFAVGDDDQSIYGFRGASPDIMLSFKDIYPNACIYNLSKNYRSGSDIVRLSTSLISHNLTRYGKALCAVGSATGQVSVLSFDDESSEAEFIVKSLKSDPAKTAVLYRNHSQSEALIKLLDAAGFAYRSNESNSQDTKVILIKDIISYLRLAMSVKSGVLPRDELTRILNRPERYLPRKNLTCENTNISDILSLYPKDSEEYAGFSRLFDDLARIASMYPYAAVSYILNAVGLKSCYPDSDKIFPVILSSVKATDGFDTAIRQLTELTKKDKASPSAGKVSLLTFHASKGLEFDRVFIADANEGITPAKRASTEASLEEERRLFYVAMTRAKQSLYICHVRRLHGKETYPSRFIKEAGL